MGSSSRWAKLRAALIAYFVLFNVLAAVPTLGTPSAERLERPFEREELEHWSRLIRAVGVDMDPERLRGIYLPLASAVGAYRKRASVTDAAAAVLRASPPRDVCSAAAHVNVSHTPTR